MLLCAALGCTGDVDGGPAGPSTGAGLPGGVPDPGRVVLHRLNRTEYDNTVRDLLGTSLRPAQAFPDDDVSYHFDNVAEVLSLSPLHVEMIQQAAEQLIDEAVTVSTGEAVFEHEAEELGSTVGAAGDGYWNLWSNGEISATIVAPADGDYAFAVRAWQSAAGPDPAHMTLSVDGVEIAAFDVAVEGSPGERYEATAPRVREGSHQFTVAFTNDFYMPDVGADRNLYVDWLQVRGPIGAVVGNPLRERIYVCEEETRECARAIFEAFARRAWRRPVTGAELDHLLTFLDLATEQGDDFHTGVRQGLVATLVAPHFVYRVEIDPDPSALEPHPLSDHELASRLSYFLWSTMPDAELFELADAGTLSDDAVLLAQVRRMLADPKADALVTSFAGQWLQFRDIGDFEPDYAVYPSYSPEFGQALRRETELFVRELLFGGAPLRELLTADWSFVDRDVAAHYGLDVALEPGFHRVTLPPERRAGILSKGAIHVVTSYPRRTSPVRRGAWVLERLLCDAPDDPPAGVEGLEEQMITAGTLRERMEIHRTNPICASCHDAMDGIGFALEAFDGVGAHRTEDGGAPILTDGVLDDGTEFDGAVELAALLAEDPRFYPCLAEKLLVYGVGRGTTPRDDVWLDVIAEQTREGGDTLSAMIEALVTSPPFRTRRGPGGRR